MVSDGPNVTGCSFPGTHVRESNSNINKKHRRHSTFYATPTDSLLGLHGRRVLRVRARPSLVLGRHAETHTRCSP